VALAAAAAALLPAPARAWDDVGHQAIALVAWRAMAPATRARAVALLRAAPPDARLAGLRPSAGGPEARDRALFARAAAWPDYVKSRRDSLLAARSRRYNHPTWHYLNQYWQPGAGGWPQVVTGPGLRTEPEDVVERIRRFSATVGDARRPPRSAPWSSRGCCISWATCTSRCTPPRASTPPIPPGTVAATGCASAPRTCTPSGTTPSTPGVRAAGGATRLAPRRAPRRPSASPRRSSAAPRPTRWRRGWP
jgi:hypothetical protein